MYESARANCELRPRSTRDEGPQCVGERTLWTKLERDVPNIENFNTIPQLPVQYRYRYVSLVR
jgi:hypothetical protein